MDRLIGEPPATPDELLPLEIKEWIARWRGKRLTLAQAKVQAVLVHADIGKRRGKLAADAWWSELLHQEPKLG